MPSPPLSTFLDLSIIELLSENTYHLKRIAAVCWSDYVVLSLRNSLIHRLFTKLY